MKVLVTGGTKGIGFAVAKHLVEMQDEVCVVSRKDDHVQGAMDALGCRGLVGDVCVDGVIHSAKAMMRGLDAVIHCAGAWTGDAETVTTNVLGSWIVASQACQSMESGVVLLMAGGGAGGPHCCENGLYGATKVAVVQMAETLAHQYPRHRVNSVAPGQVATDISGGKGEGPEKAVALIAWLLGDEAKGISGRCVAVRDQGAWKGDWRLFGEPPSGAAGKLRRVEPPR